MTTQQEQDIKQLVETARVVSDPDAVLRVRVYKMPARIAVKIGQALKIGKKPQGK
jgi:hypothetical protein